MQKVWIYSKKIKMKWVEGACSPPPILKLPLLKLPIEERGCRKTRFLLGKILQSLIKANFSEYSFEMLGVY